MKNKTSRIISDKLPPEQGGTSGDSGPIIYDDTTAELIRMVDSTAQHPPRDQDDAAGNRGAECLQLIEAIRLTAPEYLSDVFGRDATVESVTSLETEAPVDIGRFRIVRALGRGGHGVVFLATDPTLQRHVALKIPRPETLMTDALRRRFLREAEAAAALSHPNILPIYESGTDGAICYIATAYCSGKSLAEWTREAEQPITPQQAARIVAVLADAVQHAHARGILHRDIKPANVLLDFSDDADRTGAPVTTDFSRAVRLADFGLARLDGAVSTDSISAELLGTPSYMSPEQALGESQNITTASDVYGLGATLFCLLAGRPPLQRDDPLSTLLAVRTEQAPPPSRLAPAVPRDLDAICLRCLEKHPNRRYASAKELRDDLHRFLDHRPVHARPVTATVRLLRWCRRRSALAAMAALVLLSVVIGAGNVLWQWSRAERHLAESRRQSQRAMMHLQSAQHAVDQLLTEVAQDLGGSPQTEALRRNLLYKAAEINARLLLDEEADESTQLKSLQAWRRSASIFRELGDDELFEDAVKRGFKLARSKVAAGELAPHFQTELANLYYQRGRWQYAHQAYEPAIEDYREARDLWAEVSQAEPADLAGEGQLQAAETTRLIGTALEAMGKYPLAGEHYRQAVSLLGEVNLPEDHGWKSLQTLFSSHRAAALTSLGKHYRQTGQKPLAAEQYRRAADILEELIAQRPLVARYRYQLAVLDVNRGHLHVALNQYRNASRAFDAAAARLERLAADYPLSPNHKFWLGKSLSGRALVAHRSEDLASAENLQRQATTIFQDVANRFTDRTHRQQLAEAHGLLAKFRRLRGDFAGAAEAAKAAIAVGQTLIQMDEPAPTDRKALAQAHFDLACLQLAEDEHDEAAKNCQLAISQREMVRSINPEDRVNVKDLTKVYAILAAAETQLGAYQQAAEHIRLIPLVDPESAFARGMAAIAWLELASTLEMPANMALAVQSGLIAAECRGWAVEQLNVAPDLEDFSLESLQRMEIFNDLLGRPEYRARLADVYLLEGHID